MKKQYELTNEIYKRIKELAEKLPALQRVQNGKPMVKLGNAKRIIGGMLTEEERTQVKDFSASKFYRIRPKLAVLVNHEVEMVKAFKTMGMDGVLSYTKHILSDEVIKNMSEIEIQAILKLNTD